MKTVKKIITTLLLLVLLLQSVSCDNGDPKNTENIPSETEAQTEQGTDTPKEVVNPYGDGYNNNMLVGVDDLGRVFTEVYGEKTDKSREVGIFYFMWMNSFGGVYDATKIINEYGVDALINEESEISPVFNPHYWAEPLFGYYASNDKWVIRRHAQLLAEAGVDYIVFDTTNAVTYNHVWMQIFSIFEELYEAGIDVPKITFYTHFKSMETVKTLYDDIYRNGRFESVWYKKNGKPMIIAYNSPEDDIEATNEDGYKPPKFTSKILETFEFRRPFWPDETLKRGQKDTFPWIDWGKNQTLHGKDTGDSVMTVSPAAHTTPPFSISLGDPDNYREKNRGRGYNIETGKNESDKIDSGLYFDSQWDYAIKTDPENIFVTGWNEWVAWKYDNGTGSKYQFVDNLNMEYSRDIEPMRGGFGDNFYMQMIQNIRKYKYDPLDKYDVISVNKTVDINGDAAQWDDAVAVYTGVLPSDEKRNSAGSFTKLRYKVDKAENYVKKVKIVSDNDYIYLNIETEEDVKCEDMASTAFMNILIGSGSPEMKGWEGYEYIVNRTRTGTLAAGEASVEKLDDQFGTSDAGVKAQFSAKGKYMQIKIPRSILGDADRFYFKIANDIVTQNDIQDYYVSGQAFPTGRLSYSYHF